MQAEPILSSAAVRLIAAEPIDRASVRHNFFVNVMDGAFFGLALGVASTVTVVPLFVSQMTTSAVLIGLIVSMRSIGWQLPQVLTADYVARLRRYKPMVMFMTLHERLPFLGLAILALALPTLGSAVVLPLTFLMVMWHGFGGGFTATVWQSMIAKLIPAPLRGRFYGMQSAAAELMSGGGALLAGILLEANQSPNGFFLCFIIASLSMIVSGGFIASTREWDAAPAQSSVGGARVFIDHLRTILREDVNYRWYLLARGLGQVSGAALSFYTVYLVRHFGLDVGTAGILTGVLLLGQMAASPLLGWIGDRASHRFAFAIGSLLLMASAGLAMLAPDVTWFYVIYALAGGGQAALWITTMAFTAEFGTDAQRPYYIGLGSTLVAPLTLLAPILGGVLADNVSFGATFGVAAMAGIAAMLVMLVFVREPGASAKAA